MFTDLNTTNRVILSDSKPQITTVSASHKYYTILELPSSSCAELLSLRTKLSWDGTQ